MTLHLIIPSGGVLYIYIIAGQLTAIRSGQHTWREGGGEGRPGGRVAGVDVGWRVAEVGGYGHAHLAAVALHLAQTRVLPQQPARTAGLSKPRERPHNINTILQELCLCK